MMEKKIRRGLVQIKKIREEKIKKKMKGKIKKDKNKLEKI
jgi:hypothetical protein